MANTVASRKQKGRVLQQETIAAILKNFPQLTESDVRSIPGSVPGPDIWLSEAAKQIFPFDIENKNQEALNIWKALSQVEARRKENVIPLLIFRRNRSKTYAVISLENFMELVNKANVM